MHGCFYFTSLMRTFLLCVCVCAAGYFWSLYMTETKIIGMPVHNDNAEIPDYATRVCHNMATSLPLFSILYPSIRRYTVQPTRKSENPVDCQSLKRKGGLLHNVLCAVNQVVRTPVIPRLFEALSFTLCSLSVSIITVLKMVKGKGKKGGVIQVKPIEASATAIPSSQSPPPQDSTIVLKELEETPPPSRPPSPPPSPTSVSEIEGKEDEGSEWSIEIEELSDEPKPANQPAKEKSRRDRRRSSSWSRSLMNSFRRKKRKDVKTEELYKTEPLPVDFPAKPEDEAEEPEEEINATEEANETAELGEDVDIEEIIEENTPVGSIKGETVIAEASEKKTNRLSRMLSFGTFGRRKSVPQDDETKSDHLENELKENPKINVEHEQEKKRESKSKAKAKSDTKGKHDEAEGESGQFQPEVQTKVDKKGKSKSEKKSKKNKKDKSQTISKTDIEEDTESSPKAIANLETSSKTKPKTHQRSMFTFKTFSKSVDHVKTETDVNAGQFSEQEVTDPTSDTSNKNESQLPAGVKPKRRTIGSFFKREKSVKEHETSTDSTSFEQDAPALRKGSRFRSSFGRRVKAKSTDVEPIPDEGIAAAAESNKKPGRSNSMAGFGSSFSLKKMFHSTDQPPDLIEGPSTNKGILTKRGKRTSSSRPKSVQLDETPQELEAAANVSEGTELRSSRNTIGERFITFTRDSLRIKKRQRSKSVDQVVQPSEAADVETVEIPDAVEAEEENVTTQNAEEIEVETPPSNDEEIQANPVAETVADIPPALHDEDPKPKHGILSAWFRILLLYCVHEAISRPMFDVGFCFVCILCLISCGFLVAANFT